MREKIASHSQQAKQELSSEVSHHSLIWFHECTVIGLIVAGNHPSIRHVNWKKFLGPIHVAMSPRFIGITPQAVYKYDATDDRSVSCRLEVGDYDVDNSL
jgi:hypothetical protein